MSLDRYYYQLRERRCATACGNGGGIWFGDGACAAYRHRFKEGAAMVELLTLAIFSIGLGYAFASDDYRLAFFCIYGLSYTLSNAYHELRRLE